MRLIDKRGDISLFKIDGAIIAPKKDAKKPKVERAAATYCTFPSDKEGDDTVRKNFKTLADARATMPPIPDTTPKTMSNADHLAARSATAGRRK